MVLRVLIHVRVNLIIPTKVSIFHKTPRAMEILPLRSLGWGLSTHICVDGRNNEEGGKFWVDVWPFRPIH